MMSSSASATASGARAPRIIREPHLTIQPRTRVRELAWSVAAALNLTLGVWLSIDPVRSSDLKILYAWASAWLFGANPYADPVSVTDYPPHALVVLSPLGLVPEPYVVALWTAVNVGLAVWVSGLAVGAAGERVEIGGLDHRARRTLVLMLLTCGAMRTLNQFTLLALGCALQALVLTRRRPLGAGLWLGLALVKLHIGGPFLLWSVLTGAIRTAAVAVGMTLALVIAFCVRVGQGPIAVLDSYANALGRVYISVEHLTGTTELHPLLHAWLPAHAAERATLVLIVVALALVCAVAAVAHRRRHAALEVAALVALWSLLSFRHLSYNLVLMFPALMALRFPEEGRGRATRVAFRVTLALLIVDVPMLWRRAFEGMLPAAAGPAFLHVDRALVCAVLVYMGIRALGAAGRPEGRPLRLPVSEGRP